MFPLLAHCRAHALTLSHRHAAAARPSRRWRRRSSRPTRRSHPSPSATDLASQATAPSHALDSESLLSRAAKLRDRRAEAEAEPDEADDVFGDAETSDAPYVIPAFQEKQEPDQRRGQEEVEES